MHHDFLLLELINQSISTGYSYKLNTHFESFWQAATSFGFNKTTLKVFPVKGVVQLRKVKQITNVKGW